LLTLGSPEEAAAMLWDAAKKGESWAILALLQRLAPETKAVRLGLDQAEAIDFSRLNDQELEALGRMIERGNHELERPVTLELPAPEKEN
jgi:hypothetical protein